MSLVLLHGFTGAASSWEGVADGFAPALLGHGAEGGNSFTEEVDRLAGQLAERGLERVHLAGYSMGARLALGLLVRHGHLFSRATLIGVSAGLEDEAARAERARADQRWIELLERGIGPFVDAWEQQPLFATQRRLPATVQERERRRRLKHDPQELARSLRILGLASMPIYRAELASIAVPVTLMAGAEDAKFSALAQQLAPEFTSATAVIAPGGHNLLLEAPDAVKRVLA